VDEKDSIRNDLSNNKSAKVAEKAIYLAAALLLPNIFLFFLFNNNAAANAIKFSHTSVLAAFLALVSLGIFLLYCRIVRAREGALLVLLLSWIFFWLYESIFGFLGAYTPLSSRKALLVCVVVVIVFAIFIARRFCARLPKDNPVFRVLPIIICVMFLYNFIPGLYMNVIAAGSNSAGYELRKDFVVDPTLPHPDIYWLHMDGMLSFAAVEKYFGDTQESLKEELLGRGFILNEDAELVAGYTDVAVPAMASPDFYDSYLSECLSEVDHMLKTERIKELNKRFLYDGVNFAEDVAPNLEMFKAFVAADYRVVMGANIRAVFTPIDIFYNMKDDDTPLAVEDFALSNDLNKTLLELEDLKQLLVDTTPVSMLERRLTEFMTNNNRASLWLSIPKYEEEIDRLTKETYALKEERRLYRLLLDSFNVESNKIVYLVSYLPHSPFDKIFKSDRVNLPEPDNREQPFPHYLPQHEYSAGLMLKCIDLILEENPDAVIIVQGDHGFHMKVTHDLLVAEGYTNSQVLELNSAVISAVRIPEQYGELDEPLDPLDISRFLVNNYVGENYQMLYYPG